MNTQPAPVRGHRVATPYTGPDLQGYGRMALLSRQRAMAAVLRDPHGAPRDHRARPVTAAERSIMSQMMQPRGAEGHLVARWRRIRTRWIAAGCPDACPPWAVLEARERLVWACEDCGAVWTGLFRGPCPLCQSLDVHEAEVSA